MRSGGTMLPMPLSSRTRFMLFPSPPPAADGPIAAARAVRRYRLARVPASTRGGHDPLGQARRASD
jgi:hypothetical protein